MSNTVKVNLGCGAKPVRGWVNVDKSWRVLLSRFPIVKNFLRLLYSRGLMTGDSLDDIPADAKVKRHDVSKGLPFADSEVEYVYTSHMLEHLPRDKAHFVLRECYRVLKVDGVLRIVVPDLRLLVDNYIKSKQAGDSAAADRFMEGIGLHGIGDTRPLLNRILGKRHQWAYDYDSLADVLRHVGFKDVTRLEPGKGAIPDLQLLDEGEIHPDSLYLEGRK